MKAVGYLTERGQFYASLIAMPAHEHATAKPLVFADDAREPHLRAAILDISQAALYSPHRGNAWDANLDKLIQNHARELVTPTAGVVAIDPVQAERERCAQICANLATLREWGAGEPEPGERLRQAERMIRNGDKPGTYGVPAGEAPPRYFCKKCGYVGIPGDAAPLHQRPNGTGECGYMAVPIKATGGVGEVPRG